MENAFSCTGRSKTVGFMLVEDIVGGNQWIIGFVTEPGLDMIHRRLANNGGPYGDKK